MPPIVDLTAIWPMEQQCSCRNRRGPRPVSRQRCCWWAASRASSPPSCGLGADARNAPLGYLSFVTGVIVWFLPWNRWPARTTMLLAPMGFTFIGASRALGAEPPAAFVASFVMAFIWIGVTQPPRTSFLAAPLAALTYILATLASDADALGEQLAVVGRVAEEQLGATWPA